ncbi:MAG: transcription termination factor NusA [Clostridiales bacterium]|nr:transcription termination factor NusA [Clostridiales bacterium]
MAKTKKSSKNNLQTDSQELLEALKILEKEKNISRESILEAIENSLITACKNHFGKADNVKVEMNPETCEFHVYLEKTVVEEVEDPILEISLAEARMRDGKYEVGDIVREEVQSKSFGRIATQNAKNVILQKIREEERKVIFDQFQGKSRDVVTGIVQRYIGKNVSINLGKADALLTEKEMIRGEHFEPTQRVKVYILDVKATTKGPKILVSRTHPELVKRLFEEEVAEVRDGIVEIKSISREAGSRTKMAVWSKDPDVDAVGACVGMNGARVNAIVDILNGEKIDIINWDDNAALLIQNALSPAKVISVIADSEEKTAKVIVPDYQLSLAIGKEGQNARLAARLTGFKIDIKSETQAREAGDFIDYETEYEDAEYEDEIYDNYEEEDAPYEGEGYEGEGYEGEGYEDGRYEGEGYEDEEYREGEYAGAGYGDADYTDESIPGGYPEGDYEGYDEDKMYAAEEYPDAGYADEESAWQDDEDGKYENGVSADE